MTLRNKISRLHFQTLAPNLAVLGLFLLAFSYLTWVISNRFSVLQQELTASSNASRAVLEIQRLKGDSKELLLLYRITRDPAYIAEINSLEAGRNLQTSKLEWEIQKIKANQVLLDSFSAGSRETAVLRQKLIEAIDRGDLQRESRLFKDYSTLFDINNARLRDLHSLVHSQLTQTEGEMQGLLQKLPILLVSMMLLGLCVALVMIRFFRERVLKPLSLLHRGLGDVSTGSLGKPLNIPSSPTEIKEMIEDFNTMTSKLHETTSELRDAQERALQAANVKSEFLANMSHEIRTPLNVIVGLADLIQERPLDPDTQKDIGVLRKSSGLLLNIVNDILDYSRLESGQVTVAQDVFDLPEKINSVASIIEPLARAKNVRLDVKVSKQIPKWIIGDSQLFEQALLNLANNAVKFTSEGSVLITAEPVSSSEGSKDQMIELSVVDTGIGVPADKLDKLFTRFAQADTSITRTHGGTGLGLAIVKQIALLFKGDVQAKSTEGQGSQFTFRMPIQAAPAKSHGPATAAINTFKSFKFDGNPRILLADDSSDNRYLIKTYLKNSGAQIIEAQNGREALTAFQENEFDVVLMDVQMPEVDGYQATQEIRRLEQESQRKRTPVIALTAFALKEEVERSFEHGCDAHMTKPVRRGELLQSIQDFL